MKTSCLKDASLWRRLLLAPLSAFLAASSFQAPLRLCAEIPEPPTLFYGQIINRTSGQVYAPTNGTLVWKIVPVTGGSPLVLTTQVQPLASGQFKAEKRTAFGLPRRPPTDSWARLRDRI